VEGAVSVTGSALLGLTLLLLVAAPLTGHAQSGTPGDDKATTAASTAEPGAASLARFLTGAAFGLALHEAGHLGLDLIFDADPGVRRVSFGPVPFFAITHRELGPGQEFAVASAGFWMQQASSEWLLTRRPNLRDQRAPAAKGLLAFNVLASVIYSGAAFARTGPPERDTATMARALKIDEAWVGALVLAPAVLDAWRYYRPESRTARWASRATKLGLVLLTFVAANR
jgi:hypothetical protein